VGMQTRGRPCCRRGGLKSQEKWACPSVKLSAHGPSCVGQRQAAGGQVPESRYLWRFSLLYEALYISVTLMMQMIPVALCIVHTRPIRAMLISKCNAHLAYCLSYQAYRHIAPLWGFSVALTSRIEPFLHRTTRKHPLSHVSQVAMLLA
jgi:hypothetical protein